MRIVLIGLCVGSLAMAACSKHEATQEERAGGDSSRDAVATHESNRLVEAHDAGVSFDTPATWPEDRYRLDTKLGSAAAAQQAGAAYWVAMQYQPEEAGQRISSLWRIVVFPRDQWQRIDAEAGPPVGTVMKALDAWVYVAQMPQSNPYPDGSSDAQQFDAMRLPIRELRQRISIEGDGPTAAGASDL